MLKNHKVIALNSKEILTKLDKKLEELEKLELEAK